MNKEDYEQKIKNWINTLDRAFEEGRTVHIDTIQELIQVHTTRTVDHLQNPICKGKFKPTEKVKSNLNSTGLLTITGANDPVEVGIWLSNIVSIEEHPDTY